MGKIKLKKWKVSRNGKITSKEKKNNQMNSYKPEKKVKK